MACRVTVVLLCVFVSACVAGVTQLSPCPRVFEYRRSASGHWSGHIKAPTAQLPFTVTARLSVAAALRAHQVGRLHLWYDKDVILRKMAAGDVTTIDYEVVFPVIAPLPQIEQILVNDVIVCQGHPVPSRVQTKLTLEHTLTARQESPLLSAISQPVGQRMGLPDRRQPEVECGYAVMPQPLIVRGVATERGQWPWLAAVYSAANMAFMCGGTLVERSHIITAAHCLRDRQGVTKLPKEIIVVLGKFDITRYAEPKNQPKEVAEIMLHPNYDYLTMQDDIAILRLDTPVEYTTFVRPICLWDSNPDLGLVVDREATVVGWGRSEHDDLLSDTPQKAVVPIVSQEQCLRSRPEFRLFTSERTLCAGYKNGTGPCSGDSGGGLVLPTKSGGSGLRWYLRGIVSLGIPNRATLMCDLNEYVIYTDVAKYLDWVQESVSR